MMGELCYSFIGMLENTTVIEYIAVFTGILSVWFSKKENVLVYPVGMINTVMYIYLSFQNQLFGEASVNLYYTVMSIYGWALWSRRDVSNKKLVHISYSNKKEWVEQILFFGICYGLFFIALTVLKSEFYEGALPAADAFATATAFTAMWLMVRKKIESWYWWIATNIASVPLYFVKKMELTSGYYVVLLVLAIFGLMEWSRKAKTRGA